MSNQAAIHALEKRFAAFHQRYFKMQPEFCERLVLEGQSPEVMVIACSDSRSDPAILFGAEPGELFVARTIANWVPPYKHFADPCSVQAAIAFAVLHLNVKHIMVLGHSHCAGVKTLTDDVNIAEPVLAWTKTITHETEQDYSLVHNVLVQARENLMTYPWVKERVASGALSCHAWCFSLKSGHMEQYDPERKTFSELEIVV